MMFANTMMTGIAVLTLATGAFATTVSAKGIEIEAVAEKEIEVAKPNGEVEIQRVPAAKVLPGDEVIYTFYARNKGTEPATNVVITDPIPEHMLYQDGSAMGTKTQVMFSADGGKSWGAPDTLVVVEDGVSRTATSADYTHIRWKFNGAIEPGKHGYARFRARLQ